MTQHTITTPHTAGEAAADGLLHGIGAGFGMFVYLLLVWLVNGHSPVELLIWFAPLGTPGNAALLGPTLHLGVSAIYGAIFGLIWWSVSRRVSGNWRLAVGVIFALALFVFAELAVLPAGQSKLLQIPIHFAIAHVVYGLILGYLTR